MGIISRAIYMSCHDTRLHTLTEYESFNLVMVKDNLEFIMCLFHIIILDKNEHILKINV